MAKNQLFEHLKNGLRKANSAPPQHSCLVMGFTKIQMLKMDLKKPRLVWYDALSKTFYDQGDSTKIKKEDWAKINMMNFNHDKPLTDLQYYIPITSDTMTTLKETERSVR